MPALTLVSHPLCPYVQRAVISLTEKDVPFTRVDIDLSDKPEWFKTISPLGKTPVLIVGENAIFESAVILEYLEETQAAPLHPSEPLRRAEHRSWIEFASATLDDIAGFYLAPDEAAFAAKTRGLSEKFERLDRRLDSRPYFAGSRFCLVDAAFGPIFRYFDVLDLIADFGVFADKPKVGAWRVELAARPSVRSAVGTDYNARLSAFLKTRKSHLASVIANASVPAGQTLRPRHGRIDP